MKKLSVLIFLLMSMYSFSMDIGIEDALQKAYEYNYGIKQSEKELENSKLSIREAYKGALPVLDLNSAYSGEESDGTESEDFGFSSSITLSQPIYTGGTVRTAIKSAKIYENLYENKYEGTKNDTRLGIVESYANILRLEDQLSVYKKSLDERQESYRRIKKLLELKMVPKTEVLKLEASLSQAEANIIDTENRINVAKIRLKKDIGMDSKTEINLKKLDATAYSLESIDLSGDIERALDESISAKLSKYNTQLTKASEVIARSELMPKINFQMSYSTYDQETAPVTSFSDSIDGDWQWTAGVNLTWNIFDWGKDLDAYKRAKNNTEIAAYQESDSLDNLEVSIRTAYADIENLSKLIKVREKALESEQENFKYEKLRYENSIINTVDYLEAETNLRQAEVDYSSTVLEYYVAYETYLSLID